MQTTQQHSWNLPQADSTQDSNIYTTATKSCIICNSCRYCEGLCAVFPAMEKYREFSPKDIDYLANLCHQCSECFYDCQYAPPHEFNVAIPTQFAQIRKESYKKYAFPHFLGKAFDKNAWFVMILLIVTLFAGFFLASHQTLTEQDANGDFFAIIPYTYMVGTFSIVSLFVLAALVIGFINFAKSIELKNITLKVFLESIKDALTLRYLGGHKSEGCTYPNASRSNVRRIFHHFTAYGFLFCFIATSLAAFYHHFLHIYAPYDITQLPKLFGVVGGVFLCIGTLGLFFLKLIADKKIVDTKSVAMDYAFLFMLFIVSFSGLFLMFVRESEMLSYALWFHLSTILAFFIMIPYSKFTHIFYRFIALLKYNIEKPE
ncbi:tricarballylate utilization 4Fe-4S protein TcuB [Helicobacter sp. MIT 21-1697]|uniref:tricarballylate utilization 4Fe-4S protein TcuB n=1 Tax=Helicobacter sp. MIT 21-1697 TaxID=2993733 RepID=UPI00224A728E|nr:tricarballylate utilization 4Fe-4S protein TcuB [Helicobacter sp. MIT 21-1697]MCX2717439.1 tricarballylate utilization 4Fe-4S protein TcuB [Helicobacter sp. MIT 21-1697]